MGSALTTQRSPVPARTGPAQRCRQVFVETEAVSLRNTVVIPFLGTAFDADGKPVNPATDISLQVTLDDLA
jgi:hypothetical protein